MIKRRYIYDHVRERERLKVYFSFKKIIKISNFLDNNGFLGVSNIFSLPHACNWRNKHIINKVINKKHYKL